MGISRLRERRNYVLIDQNPPEKDIKIGTQEITEALRYIHPLLISAGLTDVSGYFANGKDQLSFSE